MNKKLKNKISTTINKLNGYHYLYCIMSGYRPSFTVTTNEQGYIQAVNSNFYSVGGPGHMSFGGTQPNGMTHNYVPAHNRYVQGNIGRFV